MTLIKSMNMYDRAQGVEPRWKRIRKIHLDINAKDRDTYSDR